MLKNQVVIVRGGGDIATGTIHRLHRCGFRVLVLESAPPTAIRRTVSYCEAVYDGKTTVEDISAVRISAIEQCQSVWKDNNVAVVIDPRGECIEKLKPLAVIDAILAKKNYGTAMGMAPVTIGLGPGFTAGKDVHAVIETARGHSLGRVIYHGSALANTGIPGTIQGYDTERVIYAGNSGEMRIIHDIGSKVNYGEAIAMIDSTPVTAPFSGLVRGMIRSNFAVHKGLKIADIDPRTNERDNCYTISDKARCISGGVLEALLYLSNTATD